MLDVIRKWDSHNRKLLSELQELIASNSQTQNFFLEAVKCVPVAGQLVGLVSLVSKSADMAINARILVAQHDRHKLPKEVLKALNHYERLENDVYEARHKLLLKLVEYAGNNK